MIKVILFDERLRSWASAHGATEEMISRPTVREMLSGEGLLANQHVLGPVSLEAASQAATVTVLDSGEPVTYVVRRVPAPRFSAQGSRYSIEEAARLLGISRTRVIHLAAKRGIGEQEMHGNRRLFFSDADIENMAKRGKPGRPPKPKKEEVS